MAPCFLRRVGKLFFDLGISQEETPLSSDLMVKTPCGLGSLTRMVTEPAAAWRVPSVAMNNSSMTNKLIFLQLKMKPALKMMTEAVVFS